MFSLVIPVSVYQNSAGQRSVLSINVKDRRGDKMELN